MHERLSVKHRHLGVTVRILINTTICLVVGGCRTVGAQGLPSGALPNDGVALSAAAEACPPRPAYESMRYEEDWRYLADRRCVNDWIDGLKSMPLAGPLSVALGGDVRLRYERYHNADFGRGIRDHSGYLLQRYLVFGDLHAGERFRVFGQLESSWIEGRAGGSRPTDKNTLDVNQLFGEWTMRWNRDRVTVRAGRQEVELGSGQFTSVRDGLNDRLSFDGVRVLGDVGAWTFHAMATRVVPSVPGAFDDRSRSSDTYSGFYFGRREDWLPGATAVVAANRRTRTAAAYFDARGGEERYTIATRLWGRSERWNYDFDVGLQRGHVGTSNIRAWYVRTDNGWRLSPLSGRARADIRFSIGSGDTLTGDGVLGTFSPLFAATAYSGLSGLVGPSNSVNVAPSLTLPVGARVDVTMGTSLFWRQTREDGAYNIASDVLRTPGQSQARHVGTQPTIQLMWQPTPRVTVRATLSYFRAGQFLRETPPGESVTYVTAWWAYRF